MTHEDPWMQRWRAMSEPERSKLLPTVPVFPKKRSRLPVPLWALAVAGTALLLLFLWTIVLD